MITLTDDVSVPGWSGAGYIIIDPVTGDGAYKISGGGNGGFFLIVAFFFAIMIFVFLFFASTTVFGLLAATILYGIVTFSIVGFLASIAALLSFSDFGADATDFIDWAAFTGASLEVYAAFSASTAIGIPIVFFILALLAVINDYPSE